MRELEQELERTLKENREQKDYIFTLSNRLSAAEYECTKIQESASRAAEYRDDVLMQRDLRYENSVLKGQLEQITSQRECIAVANTKSLGPSTRKIWQEFECIAMDLKGACSSVEITIPSDSTGNKPHSGQKSKGSDSESWMQRVAQYTGVSDFHIIRALTAAGISDLVFESSFPDFQAKESPLLDQYRKHVLARAGPQMLKQLEILAYKSVISEEYFTSHILQATTKSLAGKLYEALAHLISPNDDPFIGADLENGDLFAEKEAHSPNTENPVANLFTEAIVRALELKQELVLSRSKYKLVFFNPGDVFDSETMIKDGGGESAFIPIRALTKNTRKDCLGQRCKDENTRIKLCLFPALYSRPKKDLTAEFGVEVNVGNCLLDCANFITNENQMGTEDGSFSLIVKGLVLV
ncbi:hypothetical protein C7999DRAFT_18360 [Corynascus novoguineensis]|uniref:Uncharacterized protein n=1 Tax=Corynascus novoguineensis TaxID=1126955 RepID=A0AAN7HFF2_9PEZI|nr:hypothetical protein C7999DRAFT_18360 [Corynascus novoguineensis]